MASLSTGAQGPALATSRIERWLGSFRLSGICSASAPPGARAENRRGISCSCPGTHCSTALAKITSGADAGCQVLTSPNSNWHGWEGKRLRALCSIASELSMPVTRAPAKRANKSSVELPGPQPRSIASLACSSGTRASKSWAGRVRSSSKRRYSAGSHVMPLPLGQLRHSDKGLTSSGKRSTPSQRAAQPARRGEWPRSAEAELFEANQALQLATVEAAGVCLFQPSTPALRQIGSLHEHQVYGFGAGGGLHSGRARSVGRSDEHGWATCEWGGWLLRKARVAGFVSTHRSPNLCHELRSQVGGFRTLGGGRKPRRAGACSHANARLAASCSSRAARFLAAS